MSSREIVKFRFTCEGTHVKDGVRVYCNCDMTIEGTSGEIEPAYNRAGWGYIDEYGIRHLCNREHIESPHEERKH
jgi:hypothetical protein